MSSVMYVPPSDEDSSDDEVFQHFLQGNQVTSVSNAEYKPVSSDAVYSQLAPVHLSSTCGKRNFHFISHICIAYLVRKNENTTCNFFSDIQPTPTSPNVQSPVSPTPSTPTPSIQPNSDSTPTTPIPSPRQSHCLQPNTSPITPKSPMPEPP